MTALRIGVVGGSITGCLAALQLARSGHSVEVFERAGQGLVSEGSGLGLLPATLDSLFDHGLLDRALPRLQTSAQVLLGACADEPRYGREALRLPLQSWSVNWADLFHGLRRRLDGAVYRTGRTVCDFVAHPDAAEALFTDGERRSFDLLIFADGRASLARKVLFPEHVPAYRGYVLWRGVVRTDASLDVSRLRANVTRISLGGGAGHAAFYLVPAADGGGESDGVLLNFAYYLPVAAEDLSEWLVDRQGHTHHASVPRGALAAGVEARLRAAAAQHLPAYYAQLVASTRETMLHAMFSTRVPHYRVGRVCLIGDASTLAPPFTASGVMKAAYQVLELDRALQADADVTAALDAWDARQVRFGDGLDALARHMERKLIWETPDFAALDRARAVEWWRSAMMLPSGERHARSDA